MPSRTPLAILTFVAGSALGCLVTPAFASDDLPSSPLPVAYSGSGRGLGSESMGSDASEVTSLGSAQPLSFIQNQGQWSENRRFVANGRAMVTTLERDAIVLQFINSDPRREGTAGLTVVRLAFVDVSPGAEMTGERRLPGFYNFLLGSDPSAWRSRVPAYSEVVYRGVWDGVDVRVREEAGRLKYDVVLAPGADLGHVAIRADGFESVSVGPDGELAMQLPTGDVVRQPAPMTWQETESGARIPVVCAYRVLDATGYGFDVPDRDPGLPLVIDPNVELGWSTHLGGAGDDRGWAVAVGNAGEVVVAGETSSTMDFPTTPGVYDSTFNGLVDAFIACFDPGQSGQGQLVWCTYLGGALSDRILDMDLVNGDPDAVIAGGVTLSTDFPSTPGAFDPDFNGYFDGFVARLGDAGASLVYSTFLGDVGGDYLQAIHVDELEQVTVGGCTRSPGFPTTDGSYDTTQNGNLDIFVARFDASGSNLIYSTFFGGPNADGSWSEPFDIRPFGLAVDDGEAIIFGRTLGGIPTTPGAYDESFNGGVDACVARFSESGSDLLFSTYLGGSGGDVPRAGAIGASGELIACGFTYSPDFPVTPGAFDDTLNTNNQSAWDDVFVSVLNSTGSQLLYSTFIGGLTYDAPDAIVIDPMGDVIVTGFCSPLFPVTDGAYDITFNGGNDCFVTRLSPNGNGPDDLRYSTYLGGDGNEGGMSMALDAEGRVTLSGSTTSSNFPTTEGAFQDTLGGIEDVFVTTVGALVTVTIPETQPGLDGLGPVRLSAVRPNPTPGGISYRIEVRDAAWVRVGVFDVQGRLVTRLLDRRLPAGTHAFRWFPTNSILSGIYLLQLDSGGTRQARKIVLTR